MEPFVGGGALLFYLLNRDDIKIDEYIINDKNIALMETYRTIRDNPEDLIFHLNEVEMDFLILDKKRRSEQYRSYRDHYNLIKNNGHTSWEIASLFIFLNKTCYNGLYRVNKKGEFNVPIGSCPKNNIFNPVQIRRLSRKLQNIHIHCCDFKDLFKKYEKLGNETFVYFDPPYTVSHSNNGFIEYNENMFSYDDQIELFKLAVNLAKNDVNVMVSNAAHSAILSLYSNGPFFIDEVSRQSIIGSRRESRGSINEYIITSYRVNNSQNKLGDM
jgi:DNA adenine methylase